MIKCKVLVPYIDGQKVGEAVYLNERRAKSEISHGNVEVWRDKKKMRKPAYKNKAEKTTYKNKKR